VLIKLCDLYLAVLIRLCDLCIAVLIRLSDLYLAVLIRLCDLYLAVMLRSLTSNLRKYVPPRLKKISHCVIYILLCCLDWATYILPCWLDCVTYILPCCLDCVTYILPCCYGRWFPTLRKYVPPRLKRMKMSHSLDVINNLKLLLVNSSWVWVVARVWVVAICQLLGNGPDLIQYVSAISYDGLIFRLLTNPSVTFSTRFIAWNKNAYTKSNAHDAFSKSLHQFTLKDQKIGKPIM
jgi:hypothetical protein